MLDTLASPRFSAPLTLLLATTCGVRAGDFEVKAAEVTRVGGAPPYRSPEVGEAGFQISPESAWGASQIKAKTTLNRIFAFDGRIEVFAAAAPSNKPPTK